LGSSILKIFGPSVCKKAFLLFNRNREGELDFRNFCCALSIICLGSTNEKFRFMFDLFDVDCDGLLSRKELLYLLTTLSQLLIDQKIQNSGRLRVAWVDL
jgi:Ca2+-binding EF-hand superfamily protein